MLQALARTGLLDPSRLLLALLWMGSCGSVMCTGLERTVQVIIARLLMQASAEAGGQKARVVVRGVGVGRVVNRWPAYNYYNPYYYG